MVGPPTANERGT